MGCARARKRVQEEREQEGMQPVGEHGGQGGVILGPLNVIENGIIRSSIFINL
jgi:hypothetical protein